VDQSGLRASDADRDRCIGVINHALTTGQLSPDEHGDRVNAALHAKTMGDLHGLTWDLVPMATSLRPASPGFPAGWYPDPQQPGIQRYFDGAAWTEHRAPLPAAPYGSQGWWAKPPWKGAQLGRPAYGPGALADPARRLGARLLDWLLLLPVAVGLVALAVILAAPHVGPIFPSVTTGQITTTPTPGLIWMELAIVGAFFATGVIMICYETIATTRYGRTLGKAWLHIRPLRTDGRCLGLGRSLGRAATYWLPWLFSWLGLLDPLWCLWDENRQCLHDKVVDTIVVNDLTPRASNDIAEIGGWGAQAQPWTAPVTSARWHPYELPPYGPQYGYWAQPPVVPATNGLAIASLVCSLVAVMFMGIPGVLGVIFGFVARAQIRRSVPFQKGRGMALAGIIVGLAVVVLWIFIFALSAVNGTHQTS
jgi:uncharacterized RDD family membrane protein YckC